MAKCVQCGQIYLCDDPNSPRSRITTCKVCGAALGKFQAMRSPGNRWWTRVAGDVRGPFSTNELVDRIRREELDTDTLVYCSAHVSYVPVSKHDYLMDILGLGPQLDLEPIPEDFPRHTIPVARPTAAASVSIRGKGQSQTGACLFTDKVPSGVIHLEEKNSLGRSATNSILIHDDGVSRKHCTINLVDGQFVLEDLGSSNGCRVSGNKIAGKRILRDGDLVEIGLWRATFSSGRSSEKDEPPPVAPNKTSER